MVRKLQVVVVLMCLVSHLSAGTVAIGTASARGDMRVDSYTVNGNATLFDGSVVETSLASADLRLNKGTNIRMGASSRGTLYSDRLVLQRGASELSASTPFQIEARGLRVQASAANTRGTISMGSTNNVEVAALTGGFGITNGEGLLLASVRPGHPLSFVIDAGSPPATKAVGSAIVVTGTINKSADGAYTITFNGVTYQVKGTSFDSLVGQTAKIRGKIVGTLIGGVINGDTPADSLPAVIEVGSKGILATGAAAGALGVGAGAGAAGLSTAAITGIVIGGAVAAGAGIAAGMGAFSPASR